jgi:protein TonB
MFASTLSSSWDERSRRGLTTLTSFGMQVVVGGMLMLWPLLRPTEFPSLRQLSTPVGLGQPLKQPAAVRMHADGNNAASSNPAAITLKMPARIPSGIPPSAGDEGLPQIAGAGIPGAWGPGSLDGLPNSLGTAPRPIVPPAPPTVISRLRISHVSEGDLVHKVLPVYPPLARSARIQGQVVLRAVISKQGIIKDLKLLTGHPMLVPAAIEAVRQWRYRPYVLNNEPVEVETQITVNFSLGGN